MQIQLVIRHVQILNRICECSGILRKLFHFQFGILLFFLPKCDFGMLNITKLNQQWNSRMQLWLVNSNSKYVTHLIRNNRIPWKPNETSLNLFPEQINLLRQLIWSFCIFDSVTVKYASWSWDFNGSRNFLLDVLCMRSNGVSLYTKLFRII